MNKQLETIDSTQLTTTTGGAGGGVLPALGSMINKVKEALPKPTMPLGPFYPPKPSDPKIA